MCALFCHVNLSCNRYSYAKNASNDLARENCILLGNDQSDEAALNAVPLKVFFTTKKKIFTSKPMGLTRTQALAAGFNKTITVGPEEVFLKEVRFSHTYHEAMLYCLELGGILPMEETDEFVDQMSILAEDSITPRFISLAEEAPPEGGPKALVWTLGKTVLTEGEDKSKCPRCINWTFGTDSGAVFAINPVTKTYETVSPNDRISKYFCQYLGANLATHMKVVAISSYNGQSHGPGWTVDGNPYQNPYFWHSDRELRGQWISIDIGQEFWISSVLFLSVQHSKLGNNVIAVWIGGPEPKEGGALSTTERSICAIFPFRQQKFQLNGVACGSLILGQRVTLQTLNSGYLMFNELAIYGFSTKLMM